MSDKKKIVDQTKKSLKANSIIKNHMIWSMGAGMIPVPIADLFAVSAIQLDMIRSLSKTYDIDFKETEGKAIITALTGSGLARLGASAIKFIPGVGSVLGGITRAVLSGASSYAIGEVFKKHFETGGTFLDFDPSRLGKYYDEMFEKGKEVARQVKEQEAKKEAEAKSDVPTSEVSESTSQAATPATTASPSSINVVEQLTGLGKLLQDGIITQEEFEIMKAKVIKAAEEKES